MSERDVRMLYNPHINVRVLAERAAGCICQAVSGGEDVEIRGWESLEDRMAAAYQAMSRVELESLLAEPVTTRGTRACGWRASAAPPIRLWLSRDGIRRSGAAEHIQGRDRWGSGRLLAALEEAGNIAKRGAARAPERKEARCRSTRRLLRYLLDQVKEELES